MTDRSSTRKAIEKVSDLLEAILGPYGLVLVNARFTNQGSRRILEVTIHKPTKTVSLDDCERVSRELEKALDKLSTDKKTNGLIDGPFVLQVQSPGIDRKLKTQKELKIFVGENVEVESAFPIDSIGNLFSGILSDAEDGMVTIVKPVPVEISRKKKTNKKKQVSNVLDPVTEISLEFKSLNSIRLSPGLENEITN